MTVPVYKWLAADGTETGCGTKREFEYWRGEGVVVEGEKLGPVLGYEPASEDARRAVALGAALECAP